MEVWYAFLPWGGMSGTGLSDECMFVRATRPRFLAIMVAPVVDTGFLWCPLVGGSKTVQQFLFARGSH